jgi:hypothetical protein
MASHESVETVRQRIKKRKCKAKSQAMKRSTKLIKH